MKAQRHKLVALLLAACLAHGQEDAESRQLATHRTPASLFCFTLVMPFGYEAPLLAAQQKEGVGVFGCNNHLVFSNVSGKELFGDQAAAIHTSLVTGPVKVPRSDEPGKAYLNTEVFIKVWNRLFQDNRFESYDWTLKVDVDTIVVPALLRGLLLIHCEPAKCRPLYLHDRSGKMNGPMEVISRAGMKYLSHYAHICHEKLNYTGLNEAEYLQLCLEQLGIPAEQEPNLLFQVESSAGRKKCDNMHAAFHPFKSWELGLPCLEQAGLRMFQKPTRVSNASISPTLFCFVVAKPGDYETTLISQQFLAGVGVFSCDSYSIFSNVSAKELFKRGFHPSRWPAIGPTVTQITGSMDVQKGGRYYKSLDAGIFIKVWKQLYKEGFHRLADWTLKFDVDAVFLPGRVRELLWSTCPTSGGVCGSLYVENAGHMHGPVEALTQKAVEKLIAGEASCQDSFDVEKESESTYAEQCLRQLKVPAVPLPELLGAGDPVVLDQPRCSERRAVYHPFKVWDQYMKCLAEAGFVLAGPVGGRDRWSLPAKKQHPTMLCWALVLPTGHEPDLLLRQRAMGVGIFSCDAHMVISNSSLTPAFGSRAKGLKTAVIDAYLFTPLGGKYFTALNSPVFIKAWHEVFRDGRYKNHDWTLKLDADCAIVPDRVRRLLGEHCHDGDCGEKYLSNFGGDLHGPIEALSNKAMRKYDTGENHCSTKVDYSDKGEDWYLGLCLDLLGIHGEQEPRLLSDWHTDQGEPSKCDTVHATFHPFKRWDYYLRCLCQSGYSTDMCFQMMLPQTSTKTITKSSTTTSATSSTRTSTTVTETSTTHSSTGTTSTTTKTTVTTTNASTVSSTTRETVVVSDGQESHTSINGSVNGTGSPQAFLSRLPPALRHKKVSIPLAAGGAGVIALLGTVVVLMTKFSRGNRAARIEGVMASPLPTSPTRSSEANNLPAPYSAVGTDPPGSADELLRSSRSEATVLGGSS